MESPDIIYVDSNKVQCEGDGKSIGHPRVYLEIKDGEIECPYCSRTFKLKKIKE
ncbi:MAG: zinc-finger domain-containing protein [Rickettsiales bacterium]|jgi:uncharacterized Zn-finger protein|nr:zinc-finger domain-containing protein [Rickettsiales bacterium]